MISRSEDDREVSLRNGLTFQQNISGNFPAGPERFLGFSIQLRLHASRITKRQDKLVLGFPLGLLTGPQKRFLGAPSIDLNDDPAEFCRFKVKNQRILRIR